MKTKVGVLLMVLGSVLLASALGLFLYNNQEQQRAGDAVESLMPQIVDVIQERQNEPMDDFDDIVDKQPTLPQIKTMPVEEIDGYRYIGFVGIPVLSLELPVMADWSYPQLKISPCRFTGDMYSDDLVVMAHNYDRHFGGLKDLRAGDQVTFTDMDGETVTYQVVALDVLEPTAVEEITSGAYDLTLFTCTYGGKSRVTVYCDKVAE